MLALLCLLLAAPPAQTLRQAPCGDGGSRLITLENQQVASTQAELSAPGQPGPKIAVDGYQSASFVVQCLGVSLPQLEGRLGTETFSLTPEPLDLSSGAPILWLSPALKGGAKVQAWARKVSPQAKVVHLRPADFPPTFAALRFSPLLLISASDWLALPEEARQAVKWAVAAGTTLVVTTGESNLPQDALAALGPFELGELAKPGPALITAVSQAAHYRTLKGGQPLALADGAPVLSEAPLGLGRVRVVAVGLDELEPGPLSEAVLSTPQPGLDAALAWLNQAKPVGEAQGSPLGKLAWLVLAGLALATLGSIRWPRASLILVGFAGLAAWIVPPADHPYLAESARLLVLPIGDEALMVGTLDLRLEEGGAHSLETESGAVSLEDATPAGACAVLTAKSGAIIISGEPGERRRVAFFAKATLPSRAPSASAAQVLPSWPPGPLSQAQLFPVETSLPIAVAPAEVESWLVKQAAPTPVEPLTLQAEKPSAETP